MPVVIAAGVGVLYHVDHLLRPGDRCCNCYFGNLVRFRAGMMAASWIWMLSSCSNRRELRFDSLQLLAVRP